MTRKNHRLFITIAVWIVTFIASSGFAQTERNVMTVRFDTLTLQPGQTDVFVNAYYTLSAPKPHNIRGYEARFFYDSTQMRVVEIITAGTATANIGFVITNPAPPEPAVIADDQSQEIDLKNPVLFRFRASVSIFLKDTAWIRWDSVLTRLPPYDGIDTLIMQDGWIRIQKPAINVTLASPKLDVAADSSFEIPFAVSSLAKANISQARFTFRFDSSLLQFTAAKTLISGETVTNVSVLGDSVTLDVNSTTSAELQGDSTLFDITMKAKHRTDTVETLLQNLHFVSLNGDALLGTVTIHSDTIRILGRAAQPSGVARQALSAFAIYPNPARTRVSISGVDGKWRIGEWRICDVAGNVVARGMGNAVWEIPASLPSGAYLINVQTSDGSRHSESIAILR